jgi:hypothetical protein
MQRNQELLGGKYKKIRTSILKTGKKPKGVQARTLEKRKT